MIIVCKTSNPGGGDFQDLPVGDATLFETVAQRGVRDVDRAGQVVELVLGGSADVEQQHRAVEVVVDVVLVGVEVVGLAPLGEGVAEFPAGVGCERHHAPALGRWITGHQASTERSGFSSIHWLRSPSHHW